MDVKNKSRAVRKGEIMKLFVGLRLEQKPAKLTVYEVAKLLGLERSMYIQSMLLELTEDGQLTAIWLPHRPNKMKRVFYLANEWLEAPDEELIEKFGGRTMKINSGGTVYQAAFLWGS
jgi:hypothetical protein